MSRILLLGGVGDALAIARRLAPQDIYSLAGLGKLPSDLPCQLRVGQRFAQYRHRPYQRRGAELQRRRLRAMLKRPIGILRCTILLSKILAVLNTSI